MTRGIALDIDETLSCTLMTWVENMMQIFGNPENLSLEDIIIKYRYLKNVPYWQTKEAVQWLEKTRVSNEAYETLEIMPGAKSGVKRLNMILPIVAYITVRPESVMVGTKNWLKNNGFPETKIICRPESVPHNMGDQWKAETLQKYRSEISGIVDDNFGFVNYLDKNYKGHIFLYNWDSLPSGLKRRRVYACPGWSDVVKKAEQIYHK
ncbi:MAG: hypothetical protein U0525_02720 [Patescibacteria group bacterium]